MIDRVIASRDLVPTVKSGSRYTSVSTPRDIHQRLVTRASSSDHRDGACRSQLYACGILAGCLEAIALFPLFVLIPGYAAAWALHLFDFRERSLAFRLALSLPLSIALCPIVTYLAGRFGSMFAVYGVYTAAALYSSSSCRGAFATPHTADPAPGDRHRDRLAGHCLYSLIDIQIGDRLHLHHRPRPA